jgi:hypothetical protein
MKVRFSQIEHFLEELRIEVEAKRYPDTVEYKRIESAIGILRDVTALW